MEAVRELYRFVSEKPAVWFGVLAALSYSSWPLGLVLNPEVGRHQLASQLQVPHQPYNWLFIFLDVLTGLALLSAGYFQLPKSQTRLIRLCIYSYMAFGFSVAAAALVPLNCDPTLNSCGSLIGQPLILIHGALSIVSVLCLLVSALVATATVFEKHLRLSQIIAAGVLFGWLIFGIGGAWTMLHHDHTNLLQNYFISVCSLSIILAVTVLEKSGASEYVPE